MMQETTSEARERVLDVAEQLFMEKGYKAVRLRDIADALGMKQASLYYHVPGGKEALFIEVAERTMQRHSAGLEQAAQAAEPHLEAQLGAIARWLLSQPPMDLIRMLNSDMPSLDEEKAAALMRVSYEAMLLPLEQLFKTAEARGEITERDPILLAGVFLSIISSIHHAPIDVDYAEHVRMADSMIDVMLNGLNRR